MFFKNRGNTQSKREITRRSLFNSFEYDFSGSYDPIEFIKEPRKLDSPVLFIGLGDSGLKIIQALKNHLSEVYLGNPGNDFYFLCLGTSDAMRPTGNLSTQEVVNLGSEDSRDAVYQKFLAYLTENENSPVKNMMTRVLKATNTNPPRKVNFVFLDSLEEPDSAIAIPLCHYIRSVFKEKTHLIVNFSSLVSLSPDVGSVLGSDSVFLALRERYRFSSDSQQRLELGNPGISNLASNFLFSRVILTDNRDEYVLVNSILNFLSQKINLFDTARKNLVIFSDALATARIYLPVTQIRNIVADHYRRSLFLGKPLTISQEDVHKQVIEFLYKPIWNHDNFPFSIIADSNSSKLADIYYELPPLNLVEGFKWGLIYYLNESIFPIQDFGFEVLRWQQQFLQELRRIIHIATGSLTFVTERHRGFECIQELMKQLPEMEKVIIDLEAQVKNWVTQGETISSKSPNTNVSSGINECCISRPDPRKYESDASSLVPLDMLEKRSKWIWKKDAKNNFSLQWLFAPLDFSGLAKEAVSVPADSMDDNLNLVDQSVAQIANRFINSLDIFFEIEKYRPKGIELNTISLTSSLKTNNVDRTAETAQMAIAHDVEKLKKFALINRVENIDCLDYFYEDQYSISFMRIDRAIPLSAMTNGMMLTRFNKINPRSVIFDEERNVVELEKELVLRKGEFFSPVFTGLMRDLAAFKIVMNGVYWGIFQPTPGLDMDTYCLKFGDGPKSIFSVSFKDVFAGTLKDILYYALVYIPAESLDTREIFHRMNFNQTIARIESECSRIKKNPKLRKAQKEKNITLLVEWEHSDDVFYRDLSRYFQSGNY